MREKRLKKIWIPIRQTYGRAEWVRGIAICIEALATLRNGVGSVCPRIHSEAERLGLKPESPTYVINQT